MKKLDYLNKIYEKNNENGNYIVEISLDKYGDIFNQWDHASYKKRDLNPQLTNFLDDCSADIPIKFGIDICFYLPKEVQDVEKEKIIINGIRTYFSFLFHYEDRLLKESYKKVLIYIVVSFALLSAGHIINIEENQLILNTTMQGINVGGWVFLWEAISFFFIKRTDKISKIEKYKRFITADIIFKYGYNTKK